MQRKMPAFLHCLESANLVPPDVTKDPYIGTRLPADIFGALKLVLDAFVNLQMRVPNWTDPVPLQFVKEFTLLT